MRIVILLILFLYPASFFGQDLTRASLDSMFVSYISLKNPAINDGRLVQSSAVVKCGFSLVNSVRLNFDKFSPEQQFKLAEAFQRPTRSFSTVTPSGLFRVHYDTSGIHAIRYDLNLLMQSIDSSYNYEVNYLGYLPPADNNSGGDNLYDVYVMNVGNLYGYTELEDRISGKTFTSFMVIDNDFTHTQTRGINAARVTVAHELHHAIQIGNYAYAEDDIFFHELTSTAMEEFVYDSINDYYYYMDDYFNSPDESFPNHQGYDLAIWNIFLKEEFDFRILKRQWELLPANRAMDAIAKSIGERGSNFQDLFNKFGVWTFFTGYRTIPGRYFEEGSRYPVMKNIIQMPFSPPSDSFTVSVHPVTHNYVALIQQTDSLIVLISNSDYKSSIVDPYSTFSARYELYSDSAEGLNKLTEGYFSRFTPSGSSAFWVTSEFLNNQLLKEGFVRIETQAAFPSPFRYSQHSNIYIPVKQNFEEDVELYIYSASMDLVYNRRIPYFRMFGKDIVSWNGLTYGNQKLGSGIYVYVVKSGDDISKGKIVIFND
jgi:hypothetical protein